MKDALTAALYPQHRREQVGTFNIMMDLVGLNILVGAIRAYLIPLTAAAQALHDTTFGESVKSADNEFARIEAWIVNQ